MNAHRGNLGVKNFTALPYSTISAIFYNFANSPKMHHENSTMRGFICYFHFYPVKLRAYKNFVIKISHNVEHHYSLLYVC